MMRHFYHIRRQKFGYGKHLIFGFTLNVTGKQKPARPINKTQHERMIVIRNRCERRVILREKNLDLYTANIEHIAARELRKWNTFSFENIGKGGEFGIVRRRA